MSDEPLVWVLLVPAPADWLKRRVSDLWQERFGKKGKRVSRWEVLDGVSKYSAVIDRNPGSERSYDIPLIQKLTPEVSGAMYLMYMDEAYGDADVIEEYEGGRKKRSLPDDPHKFARQLGCSLPGKQIPAAMPSASGVVLAEGVSAAVVARVLGVDRSRTDVPVRIEDVEGNALLYNSETGGPPLIAAKLSKALGKTDVYTLIAGPDPGRFSVLVTRDGKTVGSFDVPDSGVNLVKAPKLDSIKGQNSAEAIIKALRIPADRLTLKK
jgi:hypothetical protein